MKIVQECWVDYYKQHNPNCDLSRVRVGDLGCCTDETYQFLENVWDTYYGDFEYEREFKTIEQIYKKKVERAN